MLKKIINGHLSDLLPLHLPSCISMTHYSKTISVYKMLSVNFIFLPYHQYYGKMNFNL